MGRRHVPVVAVELLAVGLVGDAADAEVLLAVALVDELGAQLLAIADLMVEPGKAQRLVEGDLDVLRQATKAPPGRKRAKLSSLICSSERKKWVRSFLIGPPSVKPNWSREKSTFSCSNSPLERSESLASEEAEGAAVDVVGAGLGHDRERAARRAADLGVEAVGDHAELADGVLAEANPGQAQGGVGQVDAVDQDRRLAGVAAGAHHRAVGDEAEAAALALHAGRDEGETLEVAVGDRQLLICSGTMLVEESVLNTSTMGASATTLTVSLTWATGIVRFGRLAHAERDARLLDAS